MVTNLPRVLNVDNFEMRLAEIANVDIAQLQTLSISVGWPHRAADWQHLLDIGKGYVALDEIGRVAASAMWFAHGERFATIGMLITSPRLQAHGAARFLTQRILTECGHDYIRLNATREARRLYASFGFVAKGTVYQCQGVATAPKNVPSLLPGLVARRLDHGDLDAIIALDTPAFGAVRRQHLQRLFDSSITYGLCYGGRLVAYSMRRRFGRGHVIGPIVATGDEDAISVTLPHVAAHVGGFLRIDTHARSGAFSSFVQECGLAVHNTVTTLVAREEVAYGQGLDQSPMVYALASHSMG